MTFSQRLGIKPKPTLLQIDAMSDELRNTLWSYFDMIKWQEDGYLWSQYGTAPINNYAKFLWFHHYKIPVDTIPDSGFETLKTIRKRFFSCTWNEVYDFLEFTLDHFREEELYKQVNHLLERELSGYRFVNKVLTPITSQEEISAVEEALSGDSLPGVTQHLSQAISLLADRKNPDFRNSIKESISAIESAAKVLSGNPKATLADGLKILERGGKLHPSLKERFSKIYGYSSDADGIRHAMLDVPNLDLHDAKFFLIASSAFINYLKARV